MNTRELAGSSLAGVTAGASSEVPALAVTNLAIDGIAIPDDRARDDLGDLGGLRASIKAVGLLTPVVVTTEHTLVAGERRLTACRELGWAEIPASIVDNLQDAVALLRAEIDENVERKPFTPYEASRARERQAELLKPLAEARKAHGQTAPGKPKDASSNLEQPTGRTRKLAAAGTGYSGSSLDKVDKIRDAAERGVVKVGKTEMPVPDEVKAIANEALADVKQTGAAIDRASKRVDSALANYLDTPDRQVLVFRKDLANAMKKLSGFTAEFKPEEVAGVLTLDEFDEYELHRQVLVRWFDAVLAGKPKPVRLIGENK